MPLRRAQSIQRKARHSSAELHEPVQRLNLVHRKARHSSCNTRQSSVKMHEPVPSNHSVQRNARSSSGRGPQGNWWREADCGKGAEKIAPPGRKSARRSGLESTELHEPIRCADSIQRSARQMCGGVIFAAAQTATETNAPGPPTWSPAVLGASSLSAKRVERASSLEVERYPGGCEPHSPQRT